MRLTHVLLKQYGDELGYTLDEIKNVLKDEFSLLKEIESFSLSEIIYNIKKLIERGI